MSGPYDGKELFLERMPIPLGREHSQVDVSYDFQTSRHHAKIIPDEEVYWIEDTQSTHGTYLNEKEIKEKTLLESEHLLRLGNTWLKFVIHPGASENTPAEWPTDIVPDPKLFGTTQSEAIMVADLSRSTHMANKYGNMHAMKLKETLAKTVDSIAIKHQARYIKGTGDGCMVIFERSQQAVLSAIEVLRTMKAYNEKAVERDRIDLRFSVNFGETHLDSKGDRHGDAVNMAFRLEGVKVENLLETELGMKKEALPEENRILIAEHVHMDISSMEEITCRLVGFFEFKGMTGRHKVFEVMWDLG